jgi:hypothetical protein
MGFALLPCLPHTWFLLKFLVLNEVPCYRVTALGSKCSASRPGQLTLRETAPVAHRIGGRVGPGAGLVLSSLIPRFVDPDN